MPLHRSDTAAIIPKGTTGSTTANSTSPTKSYVVGTRKSALALIQTHHIADALIALHPDKVFTVEHTSTSGDRNQSTPLHLLSPFSSTQPAKSLWTDELEALLAAGQFDLLVHSLKDVPTSLPSGFEMGACFKREDPRDALVVREGLDYKRLEDLPDGSVVGTGSVRRVAQLKRAFPGLVFEDMVCLVQGIELMGREET
jgi:hydroxymethylbilane synthase